MELVLFSLVLFLLLLNVHHVTAEDTEMQTTYADFRTYSDNHPNRCHVCKSNMLPMTSAKRSKVFTCSHGKHVHDGCVRAFYMDQNDEKRCPHTACHHAPLVRPDMEMEDRSRFYDVYQTLKPTLSRPGKCKSCREPLYGDRIQSLRMSSEFIAVCAARGHAYHLHCSRSTNRCRCGGRLKLLQVSLEGFLSLPERRQMDKLTSYYTSLLSTDHFDQDLLPTTLAERYPYMVVGNPPSTRQSLRTRTSRTRPTQMP